jgi:DNA-binding transcriptional ArsR family regulator
MSASLPRRDLDLRSLKALAHPLRQRILYHLAFVGEANSTSIAKAFDENTGATSYHLRQLAAAGLVEEVSERGGKRERWWRVIPLDLRVAPTHDTSGEQMRTLSDEWDWIEVERDHQLVRRYRPGTIGSGRFTMSQCSQAQPRG